MPGEGDALKKVASGDPIEVSHETWNCFIDAALATRRRIDADGKPRLVAQLGPGECFVRNDTGAHLSQFAVVCLGSPVIDPALSLPGFNQHVWLAGITPADDTAFAILQEPCAIDAVARAVVSGVTPVLLNVIADEHKWAEPDTGDTPTSDDLRTSAARTSAQIIWKESGTGTGKRAVVRISNNQTPPQIGYGRVLAPWDGPGTQSISIQPIDPLTGDDTDDGPIDVGIEFGVSDPQWCAYQEDDVVGYVTDSEGSVLLRNRLPQLTATYQGWYRNEDAIVVADWLRAADGEAGGGGGGGGGGGTSTSTVYTVHS